MNPLWKVYKSKVLKTLNPDQEEDTAEEVNEVENDVSPVLEDEGPSAVSQLAKRVQGAGTKGWNRMSALFNKDDEHQLLEETESQPVADHPLAMRPEEPRPAKRSPFWDNFATKWQQAAAMKQQEAAAAATATEAGTEDGQEAAGEGGREERQEGEYAEREESEGGGGGGGGGGGSSNNSFSKYASLGGGSEDTAFKWNFVTSKLAELKTKSMAKTN